MPNLANGFGGRPRLQVGAQRTMPASDHSCEGKPHAMTDAPYSPMRLSGSPAEAPVQYMRLEDALNALGQQDYAAEWGRLPGWLQMPFRWRSKSREYVRHELRLFGRRARLQRVSITLELTKAEKQACIQLYKQVRATIREALEHGKLHACAVHHATGDVTSIEPSGIWRKQAGPIFFTGRTVMREPDLADRIADVVLNKKRFGLWLADRARAQAKTASVKMLQDLNAVIAEHRQQYEYQISRSEAKALVLGLGSEHGKDVSDRQFGAYVWKPLKGTAGRRTKAQQTLYKQHEMDLKQCLAVVFGAALGR